MIDDKDKIINRLILACATVINDDPEDTSGENVVLMNTIAELTNIACSRRGLVEPALRKNDLNEWIETALKNKDIKEEFGFDVENILKELVSKEEPFKPVEYQEPLLKYLLFINKGINIIATIESLAERIKGQLHLTDFQRTRTGVTRCFTNIRFASTTLRQYGLIRDDYDHAYKKWDITLLGLLVVDDMVGKALDMTIKRYEIPRLTACHPLSPEISGTMQKFADPAYVIQRLNQIVKEPFKGFDAIGKIISGYCGSYKKILTHYPVPKDKYDQLRKKARELLEEIDKKIGWEALKEGVCIRVQIPGETRGNSMPPVELRCLKCLQCNCSFIVDIKNASFAAVQSSLFDSSETKAVACPKCKYEVKFSA